MITTDRDRDVSVDAPTPDRLTTGCRHLHVIGPSAPDVVVCVGGWIFDLAMAGWKVMAVIPGLRDTRPLRIQGAQTGELGSAAIPTENRPGRVVLAVALETFANDEWVRRLVATKVDDGSCDLAVWGDVITAELPACLEKTSYRLSAAATAFKKQAMTAATSIAAPNIEVSEVIYTKSADFLNSKRPLPKNN